MESHISTKFEANMKDKNLSMMNREELERLALDAIPAFGFYELQDQMDSTPDEVLRDIIDNPGKYDCIDEK